MARRPDPADAARRADKLAALELHALRLIEGVQSGLHRSARHGQGVEFARHREYAPGDDPRRLDWKALARSDRPVLKEFERDTDLAAWLLIDRSSSMTCEPADSPKLPHALLIAAVLAALLAGQNDRAGVVNLGSPVRLAPGRPWREVLDFLLADAPPTGESVASALAQTLPTLGRPALVVVLSDGFDDPGTLADALAIGRRAGHDLAWWQVIDRAEEEFTFQSPVRFRDPETGREVALDPRAARSEYLQAFRSHQENLRRMARSLGVDWATLAVPADPGPALAAWIARRRGTSR